MNEWNDLLSTVDESALEEFINVMGNQHLHCRLENIDIPPAEECGDSFFFVDGASGFNPIVRKLIIRVSTLENFQRS